MLQIKQLNVVLSKKGITYVTHTHSYNEGGEGANPVCRIIDDPKESSMNLLRRLGRERHLVDTVLCLLKNRHSSWF